MFNFLKNRACSWLYAVLKVSAISAAFYIQSASAQTAGTSTSDLAGIATNLTGNFGGLAQLITASSYVAGLGFAVGAILQFKGHKDNPQQVTIGKPIALLFVAAALIFLPNIFQVTGQTIFAGSQTAAGVAGISAF